MSSPGTPMQCVEFEALLSDALDGQLPPSVRERFDAHRAECPKCGVMFAEVEAGMRWLESLDEVEAPATLVQSILAETTGVQPTVIAAAAERASGWQRLRDAALAVLRPALQPRFAMSFAMAFFSISIVLNLAGVDIRGLHYSDLTPAVLKDTAVRTYYETEARVVRYYENLRFVYEIESRVRELKNTALPDEQAPAKKSNEKKGQNDRTKSGDQDRKDQRQYSRELSDTMLAWLRNLDLPSAASTRSEA